MAIKHFAVVGHPLDHSLSPILFNAAFKELSLDYSYAKEDIALSELRSVIGKIRSGGYSGLSITVPYKEEAIQFVDELTPEARTIGAINTIFPSKGKVMGGNTDWFGFKKALEQNTEIAGKKILVYGAGGAARACLYALQEFKENVFIANRTKIKGRKLAEEFGMAFVETNKLPHADILINATSSSLNPDNGLIVPEEYLKHVSVVFDLAYGDALLTETAKKLNIQTIDGKEMLLYQAVRQFELFTGEKAPIEVMRESLSLFG